MLLPLVEAQEAVLVECLLAARRIAGQLGRAVLGSLVVRQLVLLNICEVASRHVTGEAQASFA